MLINLTKSSYNIFRIITKEKIDTYSKDLEEYRRRRNAIFTYIKDYETEVSKLISISDLEKLNNEDYTNKHWIATLSQMSIYHVFGETIIRTYLSGFRNCLYRIQTLKRLVNVYTVFYNIPFSMYDYYTNTINDMIMKTIFTTGSYGFGSIFGNISIKYKERDFTKIKYDWDESLNTLLAIVKEVDPELHNSYIDKIITKKQFIQESKKYVYNETNPNGKKWLVRRDDDGAVWFIWNKPMWLQNYQLYSFTPTNYIHTPSRSQNEYVKTMTSVDEAINDSRLGNRDKLNIIYRFDPLYFKR